MDSRVRGNDDGWRVLDGCHPELVILAEGGDPWTTNRNAYFLQVSRRANDTRHAQHSGPQQAPEEGSDVNSPTETLSRTDGIDRRRNAR